MSPIVAAYFFIVLIGAVVLFQGALAAGAPWGSLAWGGRFPGRLPMQMRMASVASALLLVAFGITVAARAGIAFPNAHAPSTTLVWGVVVYSGLGVVANAITRSRWERRIWLPVTVLLLVSSYVVATGP